MRTTTAVLATAALGLAAAAAAQDEISFRSTELDESLYMLEGVGGFTGGNLGLLTGEDGVVLIDDGLEQLSDKVLAAVDDVAGGPANFVINTHVHGDHVGGNAAMHRHGATIVAHDNIRERMLDSDTTPDALPRITFASEVELSPERAPRQRLSRRARPHGRRRRHPLS
ncbi:MAG: MBL fold metallo-hydrolase [Woeseiaceae bacterium]|nr:MBL fold metallo-hydrolase [Woeseiaceae bacterium]